MVRALAEVILTTDLMLIGFVNPLAATCHDDQSIPELQ